MNTATESVSSWQTLWSSMMTDPAWYLVAIILSGLFLLQVLFLIVLLIHGRQIRRFRRRYATGSRLESYDDDGHWQGLRVLEDDVSDLRQALGQLEQALERLEQEQKEQMGRIGIVRYNALKDEGGHDLSFSIAWLNQRQDGVVVTGIYVRGESNIYAKPVIGGQSPYPLSEEERMAIQRAVEGGDMREQYKKSTADAPLIRVR